MRPAIPALNSGYAVEGKICGVLHIAMYYIENDVGMRREEATLKAPRSVHYSLTIYVSQIEYINIMEVE